MERDDPCWPRSGSRSSPDRALRRGTERQDCTRALPSAAAGPPPRAPITVSSMPPHRPPESAAAPPPRLHQRRPNVDPPTRREPDGPRHPCPSPFDNKAWPASGSGRWGRSGPGVLGVVGGLRSRPRVSDLGVAGRSVLLKSPKIRHLARFLYSLRASLAFCQGRGDVPICGYVCRTARLHHKIGLASKPVRCTGTKKSTNTTKLKIMHPVDADRNMFHPQLHNNIYPIIALLFCVHDPSFIFGSIATICSHVLIFVMLQTWYPSYIDTREDIRQISGTNWPRTSHSFCRIRCNKCNT
jgi:hypothetical protein